MGHRRLGQGPSAELLGTMLAAVLADTEDNSAADHTKGHIADDLARQLNVPRGEARTAAYELARSGCLRIARVSTNRAHNGGRYSQSFALPLPGYQFGSWRHPRLCPTGLVIEADAHAINQMAGVLRMEGVVPVAVHSVTEGVRLLGHWAFELVLLACPSEPASRTMRDLAQLRGAMRAAACGPLLLVGHGAQVNPELDEAGTEHPRPRMIGCDSDAVRSAVAETLQARLSATAIGYEATRG